MSKTLLHIPELQGKELSKFLKDNKKQLIAQKKATEKRCDAVMHMPMLYVEEDGTLTTKALSLGNIPDDAMSFPVKVVANTSMWCDTAMDVLLRDAGKKSIKERKGLIPHIKNHDFSTDAEVGKVQNIYYMDMPLRELGLKKDGTAQALMMDSEVMRAWDEKTFLRYKEGRAKQHSIAIRYVDLQLALNEPDDEYYEDEYKVWKKYIDQIINKEVPEERGYFWAVAQFMLIEVSVVLAGANILTPTYSIGEKSITEDQPPVGTVIQPVTKDAPVFDLDAAIKQVKIIV